MLNSASGFSLFIINFMWRDTYFYLIFLVLFLLNCFLFLYFRFLQLFILIYFWWVFLNFSSILHLWLSFWFFRFGFASWNRFFLFIILIFSLISCLWFASSLLTFFFRIIINFWSRHCSVLSIFLGFPLFFILQPARRFWKSYRTHIFQSLDQRYTKHLPIKKIKKHFIILTILEHCFNFIPSASFCFPCFDKNQYLNNLPMKIQMATFSLPPMLMISQHIIPLLFPLILLGDFQFLF